MASSPGVLSAGPSMTSLPGGSLSGGPSFSGSEGGEEGGYTGPPRCEYCERVFFTSDYPEERGTSNKMYSLW
jgi:hypothetical protein